MGTEDLILDIKLLSSICQTQIHNLRMARKWVIEGQQPIKKPSINVETLYWQETTQVSVSYLNTR